MRLEYPQKPNGMYFLKKEDFETIATMLLKEYCPNALMAPMAVDLVDIAEEKIGLTIRNDYLSHDNSILGLTAFAYIPDHPGYDRDLNPTTFELSAGSVVLNRGLACASDLTRKRFTLAHEISHWVLHRSYHSPINQQYQFRQQKQGFVACRTERIESAPRTLVTDNDWEEWQADMLAAALLMPQDTFLRFIYHVLDVKITRSFQKIDPQLYKYVLEQISKRFQVSRKAADIRLRTLNLAI